MNEDAAVRAGGIQPRDFAEMTVEGLDDETSPLVTVRVHCKLCAALVSDRTYDVRLDQDAAPHGEADARAMLEHLNQVHGHQWQEQP